MKPNIARLERLCVILESIDPRHFDLGTWASPACGTTACAIGFAALDPAFRAEGFELQVGRRRLFCSVREISATSLDDVAASMLDDSFGGRPAFKGYSSWSAVNRFFCLTPSQSDNLFALHSYEADERNAPDAVVHRIRELIDASRVTPKLEPEVAAALA